MEPELGNVDPSIVEHESGEKWWAGLDFVVYRRKLFTDFYVSGELNQSPFKKTWPSEALMNISNGSTGQMVRLKTCKDGQNEQTPAQNFMKMEFYNL